MVFNSYDISLRNGLLYSKIDKQWLQYFLIIFNIFITPIGLLIFSIHIYVIPCIKEIAINILFSVLFEHMYGYLDFLLYTDDQFLSTDDSLGPTVLRKIKDKNYTVKWVRCRDIYYINSTNELNSGPRKGMRLFSEGINPADVQQGELGDCWLLSALSALSEFPDIIRTVYLTDSYNPRGQYRFRFYDFSTGKATIITVDDHIPVREEVHNGVRRYIPLFSQPKGPECWVLLLEKAFAKYVGSYSGLIGGFPLFALYVLTGNSIVQFANKDKTWKRLNVEFNKSYYPANGSVGKASAKVHPDTSDASTGMMITKDCKIDDFVSFYFISHQTPYGTDKNNKNKLDLPSSDIWNNLRRATKKGYICCASTISSESAEQVCKSVGLVPGHAYTILGVFEPQLTLATGIKIVKLRNPWGEFEWTGDWSDHSDMWKKYAGIKFELQDIHSHYRSSDDGVFHMSWDDFQIYFDSVDVCFHSPSSVSVNDLALDTNESLGVCGPCLGMYAGCMYYWCCCSGLWRMWSAPCQGLCGLSDPDEMLEVLPAAPSTVNEQEVEEDDDRYNTCTVHIPGYMCCNV